MTREISVTQARAELADLVSRVGYSGERVLLTRHGRPLAALVPVDDLESLERRPTEIGFGIAGRPGEGPEWEEPAGVDPASPAEVVLPPEPEPRRTPRVPLRIAAEQRRHQRR